MTGIRPPELDALLSSTAASAREDAWQQVLATLSPLLMHVCRSFGGGNDAAMDRYAVVLEGLRENDWHRLRQFAPERNAKFTTWLVVVVRRLCLEHQRARFGRTRGEADPGSHPESILRRRLELGLAAEMDVAELRSQEGAPLDGLEREDLTRALQDAVSSLAPKDRLMLQLRFESDCTAAEIARSLSLPTAFHVYRRLRVLLAELRRTLQEGGF